MHVLLAASCTLLLLLVAASPGPTALSAECGTSGFVCAGAGRVQHCVDGVAQGPAQACGDGFLCDVQDELGPCVPAKPSCCAEGAFPVPDSCRIFAICVTNGQRLLQYDGSCAPGFEFSPRKLRCLPMELAGCSVPEPSTTTGTSSSTSSSSSVLVNATSATEPATSTLGSTTTIAIPKPSSTTTTSIPVLTTTTTPRPLAPPTPAFVCTAPGQFTDPSSCSHYMVCSWGAGGKLQGSRTSCTPTLVYDTTLRQCVYTTNCGTRPK